MYPPLFLRVTVSAKAPTVLSIYCMYTVDIRMCIGAFGETWVESRYTVYNYLYGYCRGKQDQARARDPLMPVCSPTIYHLNFLFQRLSCPQWSPVGFSATIATIILMSNYSCSRPSWISKNLKEAIKERKKPVLDHLPADALDLWKVSISFDDRFEENVNALDLKTKGRLLPRTKLSSLFSKESTDDFPDIVIKVPGY
jgi:hypothetical protein